nr:hypothetical protein [uncultured Desulfobulbus sp.]
MAQNNALFNLTQLAEASYADLSGYLHDSETFSSRLQGIEDETILSPSQATNLANHWEVAAHQPDTDSGFSATLFRSLENGEYVLVCRGTAGGSDISTDLGDIYRQEFTQREFAGNQFIRN